MLPTRTENFHWTRNVEEAISDLEKAVCVDRQGPTPNWSRLKRGQEDLEIASADDSFKRFCW